MNIYLRYISGVIENKKLEEICEKLKGHNITLEATDTSGAQMMSMEELMAPIALVLSSDVIQALATNVYYDVIKATVLSIWQQISGKKYSKFTQSKIEEIEASFDLDIRTPTNIKVQFKLKGDISPELKDKCVEDAFKLIKEKFFSENSNGYICRFNNKSEVWEDYEYVEYIRKFIKNKKD